MTLPRIILSLLLPAFLARAALNSTVVLAAGTLDDNDLSPIQWQNVSAFPDVNGVFKIDKSPDISESHLIPLNASFQPHVAVLSIAVKNNIYTAGTEPRDNKAVQIDLLPGFSLTRQGGIQTDGKWFACLYLYELQFAEQERIVSAAESTCPRPVLTYECGRWLRSAGDRLREHIAVVNGNISCPEMDSNERCRPRFVSEKPRQQSSLTTTQYNQALGNTPSTVFQLYTDEPDTLIAKHHEPYDTPWLVQTIWTHIDAESGQLAVAPANGTTTTITCIRPYSLHPDYAMPGSTKLSKPDTDKDTKDGQNDTKVDGNKDQNDHHGHPENAAPSLIYATAS